MKRGETKHRLSLGLLLLLSACTVGPDYVRPTMDMPTAFKESAGWKLAEPKEIQSRGNWWEMFNDPLLNELEAQVSISNQNLIEAEARFRQARALVQESRAGYFPSISGTVSSSRSGSTSNANANDSSSASSSRINTSHSIRADASWEADIWGRVRRTVESSQASADASLGDLEAAKLSAQAELAQNYFQLRALDTQKELFDQTIAALSRSLQLTKNRYAAGVAAQADVVQAETQLKSTMATALDIGVSRAQLEHAIALLVGKAPATFSISKTSLTTTPVLVPIGLPSDLLERRPDIAAAERRVMAANAEIGVAKSAYFPRLTLSASGGFQSESIANWLTLPNRFWSVGPALATTLFDAGLRRAQTEQAIAAYDATVAVYRQTVLTGLREVEDNVVALRVLEDEARVQEEALLAARRSLQLVTNQYKAGTVSYLNVIVTQTATLNNERTAVDIANRRLSASVALIKALGGGWNGGALRQRLD